MCHLWSIPRWQQIFLLSLGLTLSGCTFSGSISSESASKPDIEAKGLPVGSIGLSQIVMEISAQGYSAYAYKVGLTSNKNCASEIGYTIVQALTSSSVDLSSIPDGNLTLCLVGLSGQLLDMANSKSYTFDKDTTPPPIPTSLTLQVPASSPAVSTTPVIQVSGTASGSLVKIYTDASCTLLSYKGSATVAGGTSVDVVSQDLVLDGSYAFYATAQDSLGNVSACSTASLNYIVMGAQPVATLSGAPTGTNNTTTLSVTVAGTNVSHYRYVVGISSLDCTSIATYPVPEFAVGTSISASLTAITDGVIKLCVIGKNAAGTWQAIGSPTTATWTKDATGPVWSNSVSHTGSDLVTNRPTIYFTADAVDSAGIQKYQYAIGTATAGASASDIQAWTDTSASPIAGGAISGANKVTDYYVNMRAIDNLGNASVVNSTAAWKFYLAAVPVYPSNGVNWNDYVKNDGADIYSGTDTICAGTETSYKDCLHGGEMRKVVVSGAASCAGLSFIDGLGVFEWTCVVQSGAATFYTTGFKAGKGLSDLLNATSWKNNNVSLTGTYSNVGTLGPWWTNTVEALVDNSAGTVATLAGAGKIYTLSTSRATTGYNLDADKIGLVIFPGATLSWAGGPANSTTSTGEIGTSYTRVVASGSQKHLWIEGTITGGYNALLLGLTKFSTLHRLNLGGSGDAGAMLESFVANRVRQMTVYSTGFGVEAGWFGGSNYNLYEDILLKNNNSGGFLIGGSNNIFNRITVVNNGGGIGVGGTANVLNQVRTFNNGGNGINISGGTYTKIVDLISANNAGLGVSFTNNSGGSVYSILTQATIAFNGSAGIGLYHGGVTINNVLVLKNGVGLSKTSGSTADSISHFAVADSVGDDISLSYGTPAFHGNLLVDATGSCTISAVTTMTTSTCAAAGASTATLFYRGSLTGNPVLDIGVDDVANVSDTTGAASFPGTPATFSWNIFDNVFRTWGLSAAASRWTTGTASILDFQLKTSAAGVLNNTHLVTTTNTAFVAGAACPAAVNGNVTLTATTADPHTFLLNAREIMLDNVGDDNGLCESNEACLYTPNFGVYQGHGSLGSCTFNQNGGSISGITMYGYSSNGI